MSNRRNIQFTYNPHNKATILDCNFTVDKANGNGLGIRSLKGSGRIASAYMNSTASFSATSNSTAVLTGISPITTNLSVGMGLSGSGIPVGARIKSIDSTTQITMTASASTSTTPTVTFWSHPGANVPAGYIVVNLQDNYNRYLYGSAGFVAPVSGSAIDVAGTGVTINTVYIIVVLGTTSAAQWQSIGLPANIVPAVGVSFIATKTGTATGTGYVEVIAATGSGIFSIEVVGDPNQMNSNGVNVLGAGNGMQIISACFNDSSGDAAQVAAPVDNSVVGMLFYMNDSAQGV